MRFEFATAGRVLFGPGSVREVPGAAASLGRRALLVTGASPERAAFVRGALDTVHFTVSGEPTIDRIRRGAQEARAEGCDLVVAIGGGSAIDAGKALAGLMTNSGDPLDYLEVVGRGQPLERPPAPFIAVPTTAGTGSEATRNAVLGSPEHRVKASLRGLSLLPRVAVVDPELTLSLPREITASTGLDALTQLIEPYVSSRANSMTDLYCREGMRCAAVALPKVCEHPDDLEARSSMSWAALLGGMALANAGLGAVHGFAAPVGGMFPAPHGAICAAVLPHAMKVNVRALRTRAPESVSLRRYEQVACLITENPHAVAEDGVEWIAQLCSRLEIPPLRSYGVTAAAIPALVEKARQTSSMKGNPIALTTEELAEIVTLAS